MRTPVRPSLCGREGGVNRRRPRRSDADMRNSCTLLTRLSGRTMVAAHTQRYRHADSSPICDDDVQEETMTLSDAGTTAGRTAPAAGRPVVFRGDTVLTMDAASTVLTDGDVLVVDDRI